jgi:hypothetical protein
VATDAPDVTVAAADTLRADADAREAAAHARAPSDAPPVEKSTSRRTRSAATA